MTRIVYLHGFASGPSSGKACHFAAHFTDCGIAIEIPALDGGDFEHLTITGQLALIENLAAGEPLSLIGSSMGGYLAALYAATHLEVHRIALLAPAFDFARRWPESLGDESIARWRTDGVRDVFHYGEGRARKLRYDLLDDAVRHPPYPDVRQPTLIFHGSRDDVVPAALSERFAANRPNVRLEILDSGHELHDVLDYVTPRVAGFLLDAGCYPEH